MNIPHQQQGHIDAEIYIIIFVQTRCIDMNIPHQQQGHIDAKIFLIIFVHTKYMDMNTPRRRRGVFMKIFLNNLFTNYNFMV